MAIRRYKFISQILVEDPSSLWVDGFGSPIVPEAAIEIALTPGLYYVTGEGPAAEDILKHIAVEAAAADSRLAGLVFSLVETTDGYVVRHSYSGSETAIRLNWIDPDLAGADAVQLQQDLRLEGYGSTGYTLDSTAKDGDRTFRGGFFPKWYLIDDLEEDEWQGAQFVPDTGNPTTLTISTREIRRLRLRTEGEPRASGQNEYHDLKRFWRHAAGGYAFRCYPDATVTDPYSDTERYGYHSLVMTEESARAWRPQPDDPQRYKYNSIDLEAYLWDETE